MILRARLCIASIWSICVLVLLFSCDSVFSQQHLKWARPVWMLFYFHCARSAASHFLIHIKRLQSDPNRSIPMTYFVNLWRCNFDDIVAYILTLCSRILGSWQWLPDLLGGRKKHRKRNAAIRKEDGEMLGRKEVRRGGKRHCSSFLDPARLIWVCLDTVHVIDLSVIIIIIIIIIMSLHFSYLMTVFVLPDTFVSLLWCCVYMPLRLMW